MKVLSCQHIICDHCYSRLIINNRFAFLEKIDFTEKEPMMKYICKCQGGKELINLREYMLTIQEIINGKLKYKCKYHPLSMAEIYCNQCHIWFCSICFQDSDCRSHIDPNAITSKCLDHNYNDINIFCLNCKYAICRVCRELHHIEHNVILYDDTQRKNKINKFQYPTYSDVENKLNKLHKKVIDSYKNILDKKVKVFDDLIRKIKEMKQKLKNKMESKNNQISTLIHLIKLTYRNMYLDTEVDLNQVVLMDKNLNTFLYDIVITPEPDNELSNIKRSINDYSFLSTFKYELLFKKQKLNCISELQFENQKITAMASLGQDKIAIAFNNILRLYSLSKNKLAENQFYHEGDINTILVLGDNLIATGSNDKSVRLWNIKDNVEVFCYLGHLGEVTSLCFIKQGIFASAGNDSMIKIWSYEKEKYKEEISLFDIDDQSIKSLVYLSNNKIASAGESEKINIWLMKSDQDKSVLYGHVDTITKILLLKDKRIASSSMDCSIKLWKNNICQISLEGHIGGVLIIYQLKDGRLISGAMDKYCRIWDLYSNTCEHELASHKDYISSIIELHEVNNEKESLIFTGGYDFTLKIWK